MVERKYLKDLLGRDDAERLADSIGEICDGEDFIEVVVAMTYVIQDVCRRNSDLAQGAANYLQEFAELIRRQSCNQQLETGSSPS